jgi:urease accessory protein
VKLELLHLCDSLFPVGAFAHSDGLETAASEQVRLTPDSAYEEQVRLKPDGTDETDRADPPNVVSGFSRTRVTADLGQWIDVVLDENIGRLDGPAVWRAWMMFHDRDWDPLVELDHEMTALRPAASARRSSRAMGLRLLTTWQALYPDPRLEHALMLAGRGILGPALPIAFAGACGSVDRRDAVEAFAYTRLAATISAAMRLMPIGQTDAHALLARTLARVPAVVDAIAVRDAEPESFTPAMDIAAMSQQYLHSRLFRS